MKKIFAGFLVALAVTACTGNKQPYANDIVEEEKTPVEQMIRLNVFYTANNPEDEAKITDIATKLVEASRNDAGCISYDFYKSATVPGEYFILETWENDSVLDIHSNAPHFTEYVPQLRELGNMRAERFMINK